MPKYVQINKELILIEQEIKAKKVVVIKEPVNHIWIYDRSGSMYGLLGELCEQLIVLSKKLPKGDSLTLGWFSSEGCFNWIFKGFRIIDNADYKSLEAAIRNNSTTKNLTCFSEILDDTNTVITDLSVLSKTFSFNFFTDGYPVVSDYQKEVTNIFTAIKKIKGKIHSAMFVGYGCYYNKQLMAEMSEKLGAILIHSSKVSEYTDHIVKLVALSSTSEPKEQIDPLVKQPMAIFTVSDQGVIILSIDEGKIYVTPQNGKSIKLYYLSIDKPNTKSWTKIDVNSIDFGTSEESMARAIYSAALVMSQKTKTDVAIEVIGKIGDKAIVDKLNNAFMVEEFGETEEIINKAINDTSYRFTAGRDSSYLPKSDAFCVYDALNLLTEDADAAFYPYHEKFSYEKIGVSATEKIGYSKFRADKASKCPFNTLIWHESRLNLSVQTSIKGTIELNAVEGKTATQMGFISPYPTFVYRTYTFVKDGHTHTKVFYLSSSETTYKKFKNEGIIVDDNFKQTGIYAVDLGKLPAINRTLAGNTISGTELCKDIIAMQYLKGEIKSLKWLKNNELGGDEEAPKSFAEEQVAFLKANGILVERGGVYSPPTDRAEAEDYYMAKTFDIKLKGIATLPSVNAVMKKISSNKTLTLSESLVEAGIVLWDKAKVNLSDKDKEHWFTNILETKQLELRDIRSKVQKVKMAVILGRKWFEEFTSRENCELDVNGIKCIFELGEEKVGY